MAAKIRLTRMGRTHEPCYRVIVIDSRSRRDGRPIETVGTYNPLLGQDHANFCSLNAERIKHWISCGAAPTAVVAKLMKRLNIEASHKLVQKLVQHKKPRKPKKESK